MEESHTKVCAELQTWKAFALKGNAELLKTDRNLNSYALVRLFKSRKGDALLLMYARKLQALCAFAWKK